MKASLLFLALTCLLPWAQADEISVSPLVDISGRYRGYADHSMTLSIDKYLRLTTNIQVIDTLHNHAPLNFPHRLKLNELNACYETQGYFTMQYFTSIGPMACNFPASFSGDFGEDAEIVDVTLAIPQQFGLDAYGRCLYYGKFSQPLGFEKL